MLATEPRPHYRCTVEAERSWNRASALLRSWMWDSREDFAQRRWYEDYGVRIQGVVSDPLAIIDKIRDIQLALEALRQVNVNAALLCWHNVEHPDPKAMKADSPDQWHNSRGTGFCDRLSLPYSDAETLFNAGKEYVFAQLEDEPLMMAVLQVLGR